MKKFILGLVLGLIVGLLGALVFLQALAPEPEESALDDRRAPLVKARARKPIQGLEVARIKLRSFLAQQHKERDLEAHLDFLDNAIFDREWSSVGAVSESLRALLKESPGETAEPKKAPAQAAKPIELRRSGTSLAVLDHKVRERSFWSSLEGHRNDATALLKKGRDAIIAEAPKLIREAAANEQDALMRRHAAFILGRDGGDTGLMLINDLLIQDHTAEDQALAAEVIGRSGHPKAAQLLVRLTDERRPLALQKAAIENLSHIYDVVAGQSKACRVLVELLDDQRPVELRLAAVEVLALIDLKAATSIHKELGRFINNQSADGRLREALMKAVLNFSERVKELPLGLTRAVEGLARNERDGPLRVAALRCLAWSTSKDSLKALDDAEASVASPVSRRALEASREELNRKLGDG